MKRLYIIALCGLLFGGHAGAVFASKASAGTPTRLVFKAPTSDPYQALFLVAGEALRRGDYALAVRLLRTLQQKAPTPRVTLELARALYLDHHYRQAREQFNTVLDNPELPWGVRQNVRRYLDLIDESLGGIRYSIALVTDSNPLNFTSNRQIDILGSTWDIVPPANNKEAYGVQYGVDATYAFDDQARVVGFLKVDFRDFEGKALDKWVINAGTTLSSPALPRIMGRLGLEYTLYGGRTLYRMPYLALTYTPRPVQQFRLNTTFSLGYLDVEKYNSLDATLLSIETAALKTFRSGSQLQGKLLLQSALSRERPYRYQGARLGLDYSFPLYGDWGTTLSGSFGLRSYAAKDPLFQEQRKDHTRSLGFSLFNRQWSWLGMTPEIGVVYERCDSNIPYYSYDKWSLVLRARSK